MKDPIERLAAADPERARSVPATPSFALRATRGSVARGPLIALAAAAVVVVGIGVPAWFLGERDQAPAAGDTTTTTVSPTTTAPTTTTTTTEPTTTTAPSTTVAPDRLDVGPPAGAELAPVSVPAGETVSIYAEPSSKSEVVAALSLGDRVTATGWWIFVAGDMAFFEVTLEGATVFAPSAYFASLGTTDDVTSSVVSYLGGIPSSDTIEGLVEQVVSARGGGPRTVVEGPSVGDLGEVVVDLVGFEDDSVMGERLHIFAAYEGGVWGLRSVEATALCSRGTDPAGLCN